MGILYMDPIRCSTVKSRHCLGEIKGSHLWWNRSAPPHDEMKSVFYPAKQISPQSDFTHKVNFTRSFGRISLQKGAVKKFKRESQWSLFICCKGGKRLLQACFFVRARIVPPTPRIGWFFGHAASCWFWSLLVRMPKRHFTVSFSGYILCPEHL